jgi:hypothetical protein
MIGTSGPATIYLIRHGEKLGDQGDDKDGGPYLSTLGSARAAALPSLFMPVPPTPLEFPSCNFTPGNGELTISYEMVELQATVTPRFKTPDFVFATKSDGSSQRPLETITPLATALGLQPNADSKDNDFGVVATAVKTQPQYVGKVLLICWHHGNLPALAETIGATNVNKWPPTVFDQLWQIDYSSDPQQLATHYQALLYGDTAPS